MSSDFLKDYITGRGLSNILKAEFERIIFYELVFDQNVFGLPQEELSCGTIKSPSIYKISEELKIKPSKTSSILKDIFYSGLESKSKAQPIDIICKYITKDTKSFKDGIIEILIMNPVEHEIVERYLNEKNAKYDSSFNKKIIRIKFDVIDTAFQDEEKEKILEKMRKVVAEKQGISVDAINVKGKFLDAAERIAGFIGQNVVAPAVQSATEVVVQNVLSKM